MFTKTHGERKTRLYQIWWGMISRCKYKSNTSYKWYGAKGITVCDEWKKYENFSIWAKQNGYQDSLTLDRININGNYEPSNCRWLTPKEQANNRKTNHFIIINNVKKTLEEWCNIYNIDHSTVLMRIKRGWNEQDAIVKPLKYNEKKDKVG